MKVQIITMTNYLVYYFHMEFKILVYYIMPPKKKSNAKPKKTTIKKSEIVKIAKNAVKTVAEKKFFNCQQVPIAHPTLPDGEGVTHKISGIGYSTTEDVSESGSAIQFCGQQVKEMMCLRPWALNTIGAETDQKALAMEGKYLQPVSSKSRFRINRHIAEINPIAHARDANPSNNPVPLPSELATNCPVICRMMRVTPKISAGTTTEIAPDNDLFINEYGESLGPSEEDFDSREMLFYKLNKRRYTVLEDKKFKILSPLTVQWQQSWNTSNNHFYWTPLVANTNSNCEKYITCYHQLSKVKGGK